MHSTNREAARNKAMSKSKRKKFIPLLGLTALAMTATATTQIQASSEYNSNTYEETAVQHMDMSEKKWKEEFTKAKETEQQAMTVAQQLSSDETLKQLLSDAKGVFIVPQYTKAGLVVGGSGGQGVLMTKIDDRWQGPGFYNIGGISLGLQAGVESGSMAMILMTDKAVKNFQDTQNFSLTGDSGLNIVDYDKRAKSSTLEGDIVFWTDAEGAFGELSVAIQDIIWDKKENQAYYQTASVNPKDFARIDKAQSTNSQLKQILN